MIDFPFETTPTKMKGLHTYAEFLIKFDKTYTKKGVQLLIVKVVHNRSKKFQG